MRGETLHAVSEFRGRRVEIVRRPGFGETLGGRRFDAKARGRGTKLAHTAAESVEARLVGARLLRRS